MRNYCVDKSVKGLLLSVDPLYFIRLKRGAAVCSVGTRMVRGTLVSWWSPWRRRMSGIALTSYATWTSYPMRRLRKLKSWLNPGWDKKDYIVLTDTTFCALRQKEVPIYFKSYFTLNKDKQSSVCCTASNISYGFVMSVCLVDKALCLLTIFSRDD